MKENIQKLRKEFHILILANLVEYRSLGGIMRKFWLMLGLCLCSLSLYAYKAGDMSVGLAAVYSPLALGTDFGEMNVDDQQTSTSHDAKLGKPGMGGELQALYFLSPRVGIGLSFEDQYFSSDFASGWRLNTQTRMQNYMAVGHIFLTPQSTYKLYIPLGMGAAHTDFSMKFPDGKKHFSYTGFSYYVGFGVEREVSTHFTLGLEARYNGNKFHDSTTRTNGDHVVVYPRANFLSVLLRVIYKI